MKNLDSVKHDILTAAKSLFAQYGYEKTSLSAITSSIGKSKTSIYYLFKNKNDIFREVIENEFENIRLKLEDLMTFNPEDPSGRFTDYLKNRIALLETAHTFRSCLEASMKRGNFAFVGFEYEARKKFDDWEKDFLSKTCKSGQDAGVFPANLSCKAFADTISNLFKGVEMSYCVSGNKEDVRTICDTLSELLIHKNPKFAIK